MAMKLSTGKVAFPLHFDNGDVENIMINPHDEKLQDRIKNFESSIQSRLKQINLEKYKDAFDGGVDIANLDFAQLMSMSKEEIENMTKQTGAMVEIDKELEREFCAELDSVFDSDISSKAFKYVPPLAMVENEDGECELYILTVMRALAEEIQKHGTKMNNATNKYIDKYKKK